MNLLCDEDVGTGVPTALNAVGLSADSLVNLGWGGRPDVEWLTMAGQTGSLVLSCNKKMLVVPQEHDTIVRENVRIVFLTSGEEDSARVLRVVLNKWDTLELLDSTTQRPFARFLSPNGRLSTRYRQLEL